MRRIALLLVILALGVSACGSTTTVVTDTTPSSGGSGTTHSAAATTPTTTTAAPASTTSTTSTTASTPSTPTSTSPTSAAAATVACTTATLNGAYLGGQGATGHGELGFTLTNTSAAACHTYGYPGVEFRSASGAALPTDSMRTTQDFFGTLQERALTVAPGGQVSFRLGVTHIPQGSAQCMTAASLQVIPPDDTHTLVIPIGSGGAYECGTATVSPVQPGTIAFSTG